MSQDHDAKSLKKTVDLWGVIALGLGSAMGVSIFSVLGEATRLAGAGLLIAVVLAALPMAFVAVAYAFMGTVLPTSGASYEWPRRFIHPLVGFAVSWLRIASNTGALIVLALVLTRYLNMVINVPERPTMFIMLTMMFVANILGIGIASGLQKFMMAGLLLVFGVFCVSAIATGKADAANLVPNLHLGWHGILAALPLLVSLFFGIEAATEIGDEIKTGKRIVAMGILVSILSAVFVYLAVAATAIAVLGSSALGSAEAPMGSAMEAVFGKTGVYVVALAGFLAIAKSMNAIFMVFSRSLYAMATKGAFPAPFAKVHSRWGTPYVACAAAYGFALLGLFLPNELTFLFLAVNLPVLIKYFCICVCAGRALKASPDLANNFALSASTVKLSAGIGMFMAIGIFVLGFDTDWRPYAALAAWLAIGLIFYASRKLLNR